MRGKRSLKILLASLVTVFMLSTPAQAGIIGSLIKVCGGIYYTITNPVCAWVNDFKIIEEQHILPQNQGGILAVLIPKWNHSASDRAFNRYHIFEENRHSNTLVKVLTLTNEQSLTNLNNAYMLGRTMIPYAFFCFEYKGIRSTNWHFLSTEMDGASTVMYFVSWLCHTPQKIVRQIAYVIHKAPPIAGLIDVALNICSLLVEFVIGIFGTVVGVILGTLFHPIDTICSIPGLLYFTVTTAVTMITDLFTSCWYLIFG